MDEIARFSFAKYGTVYRVKIVKDSEGFYNLDEETYLDPDKINPETGQPTPLTSRKSIHGKMTVEAYANWLTNALMNESYSHAYNDREKQWMLGR